MESLQTGANRIELKKEQAPLDIRLTFLVFGLGFAAFGLFAAFQVVLAAIDIVLGRSFEGYFSLGLLIAVGFTGFGALAIWCFISPAEDLVFDGDEKTLTSNRRYPFGFRKTEVHTLEDIAAPRVHWVKDSESFHDGDWFLEVSLPSGRRFDHRLNARTPDAQKRAAEILRDNIEGLRGPAR